MSQQGEFPKKTRSTHRPFYLIVQKLGQRIITLRFRSSNSQRGVNWIRPTSSGFKWSIVFRTINPINWILCFIQVKWLIIKRVSQNVQTTIGYPYQNNRLSVLSVPYFIRFTCYPVEKICDSAGGPPDSIVLEQKNPLMLPRVRITYCLQVLAHSTLLLFFSSIIL